VIVEITLFVDESQFDTTSMISLTAMLVMYTLYQVKVMALKIVKAILWLKYV
jgi:hypothetical protein